MENELMGDELTGLIAHVEEKPLAAAYRHALNTVLVVNQPALERLRIQGADRLDLLERLSSNSLKDRQPGEHVRTALLEANGRLIDLLEVFIHADELLLGATTGMGATVKDWFTRHIFFQDDVSVELLSPWQTTLAVVGPQSAEILAHRITDPTAITRGWFASCEGVLATRFEWPNTSGFHLLLDDIGSGEDIFTRSDDPGPAAARAAAEALRIEAGIPARGQEIIPGIIPLEAGLGEAINFSKGCYVGQEVIARLESRGALAARLTGIRLATAATPGSSLQHSGREVGRLTSVARSPVHGWIGLGLIKTRYLEHAARDLLVAEAECSLQSLPFPAP